MSKLINLTKELRDKIKSLEIGVGLEKLKKANKLSARERIDYLLDNHKEAIEIGAFAGDNMYKKHGGCLSGGIIVKVGKISGSYCVVVANDSSIKSGSWFPITIKKNIRAQNFAIQNRIPIIYLVDSAGIYLPLQDKVFANPDGFGRIFKNNAKLSSLGVPQISAILGPCVAGGAYLPILSDETIIVKNQGQVFLAGSNLVKVAIGENIDNELLGGADTHCKISGVTDYIAQNDEEALDYIKKIIDKQSNKGAFNFNRKKPSLPSCKKNEIFDIYPDDNISTYDMYKIINCIVDKSEIIEYKKDYGKTAITCYARIDGWSIGIVANQRIMTKTSFGETQIGGVIYSESSDKISRFLLNCNQKKIPVLFLQDVTGFMIGSKSEQKGIIKDGAKILNIISNTTVPLFTVIIGNSYGAGHYAMCSSSFDPNLILSWPSAKIAVMGKKQINSVMKYIKGKNKISSNYDEKSSPYYAASRLWIDAVIDPTETRKWISSGIGIANQNFQIKDLKTGVLQM